MITAKEAKLVATSLITSKLVTDAITDIAVVVKKKSALGYMSVSINSFMRTLSNDYQKAAVKTILEKHGYRITFEAHSDPRDHTSSENWMLFLD